MAVYVCDSPMGAGKTSAAIQFMRDNPKKRYLFVTPYLSEVQRIMQACPELRFKTPEDRGGGKLENLHHLLTRGWNIVSTHALFGMYTPYTEELIQNGEYTLIMDEVFGVLESLKIKDDDVDALFSTDLVEMEEDGSRVRWLDSEYNGTKFMDVMRKSQVGNLIRYKNQMLYWTFPASIFSSFVDVYILTYLFDAQVQRYYYDLHGIQYSFIGTKRENGEFLFSDDPEYVPDYIRNLDKYINILDDSRLNGIGRTRFALSSNWYKECSREREKPLIDRLRKNIYNVFRNRFNSTVDEAMWTCFKKYRPLIEYGSFKNSFVSCNARATNEFANRKNLAYAINVFLNPDIAGYFRENGIRVDEDTYALSEMVQWVWRSAIRNEESINIYIPSSRMRELLINWMNSYRG